MPTDVLLSIGRKRVAREHPWWKMRRDHEEISQKQSACTAIPLMRFEEPMSVRLFYDPKLAEYRFPAGHPMRPERFTLAVSLMREWGLLADANSAVDEVAAEVVLPAPAGDDDLLLFHSAEYVQYVKQASKDPSDVSEYGLGWGDTPAFAGMHDAAALAVGATIDAVDAVLEGGAGRTFNPAGGLHHAHRDHASGFCIYNDAAVAIERATRAQGGLRVAYVDIDAHHGDGVEAAFVTRPDVLTLSVHESGRYLFPGTGRTQDVGQGSGVGFAINVPLPPFAGPDCYALVLEQVITPALASFDPDIIIVQSGADSHVGDPLAHLAQTVAGYVNLVTGLCDLATTLTAGKMVLLGGGGYLPFDAVPRMWASALAVLLERDVPRELPRGWLQDARAAAQRAGGVPPTGIDTLADSTQGPDPEQAAAALQLTQAVVREVRAVSPLIAGT